MSNIRIEYIQIFIKCLPTDKFGSVQIFYKNKRDLTVSTIRTLYVHNLQEKAKQSIPLTVDQHIKKYN